MLLQIEGLTGLCKALFKLIEGLTIFPLARTYLKSYKVIKRRMLILRQIQNRRMHLNIEDAGISTELFVKGWHELASTQILKSILTKNECVVDIGANIGYYTLLEAEIVKDGIVYAIEPDPINFSILNQNIRMNGLENVKTFNVAISNEKGFARFYIYRRRNLCSLIKYDNPIGEIVVETCALDEFLKDKKVNFIRMDVEGAEYEILNGAHETLKRKNLKLFIEFHPNLLKKRGLSVNTLLKKLEKLGFSPIYIVLKDTETILRNISISGALKNPLITSYPFHIFLEKL
jgi:FkbM family methyltransferase